MLYLTLRPELAVIGLAVIAVLGVLNACSIDWDIAAWVAGRTTPVTGLPLRYRYLVKRELLDKGLEFLGGLVTNQTGI